MLERDFTEIRELLSADSVDDRSLEVYSNWLVVFRLYWNLIDCWRISICFIIL